MCDVDVLLYRADCYRIGGLLYRGEGEVVVVDVLLYKGVVNEGRGCSCCFVVEGDCCRVERCSCCHCCCVCSLLFSGLRCVVRFDINSHQTEENR